MKMNKELAQEIANKVMTVIPYNVNIMDDVGVIIGSGDSERIGTIHQGAIEAIEHGTIVSVFNSNGSAKPGINIPIHFRDKAIGTIGISGDPDTVGPFAELVRVTAELLIKQEFLFKERRVKEQMREEFLYQWVFRNEEYDESIKNSGETVGINLDHKRKAVIVKGNLLKEPLLLEQEYKFRLSQNMMLYIIPDKSNFLTRLAPIVSTDETKIGIGTTRTPIAMSVHEAKIAIEIAEKLGMSQTQCDYQQFKFLYFLTNREIAFEEISQCFRELEMTPKGIELIETLICYFEKNGDVNAISKELHIHRNSLAYRLQKIESLTNKNPKNFTDLFQLFTGYVQYKMTAASQKESGTNGS